MARPRELYNGPAPQAMSQMGAGIADAYANVGRIHGEGYKAMGAGIAQGITAAASAYAGYKQQQSQAKAYEGFLNNELGQKALGINAETAKGYIKAAKDMGGPAAQIQFYEMGIPSLMKSNLGLQEQLKLVGARAGAESGLIDKRLSSDVSLEGLKALLGTGTSRGTSGTGASPILPSLVPSGGPSGAAFGDPRKLNLGMGASWTGQ
jgi:hypothetical protein